jgi:hypothetical protein
LIAGILLFVLPRKEKTSEPDESLTPVFVAAAIIVVIVALFIYLLPGQAAEVERMARALIGVWGRFLNEILNPGSR